MGRENHPVWAVYDKLRTARLNVRYYSERLRRLERLDVAIDVALLVAAPTSAVAGLWFFKSDLGKHVWQGLGAVSALLATVRPAFQFRRTFKMYETTIASYQALEYDLESIRHQIEQQGCYDDKLKSEFLRALERQRDIEISSPDKIPNSRLLRTCTNSVLNEMPASIFFVPET